MQTGVYLITNLYDGKNYIGSTTNSFRARWNEHIRSMIKRNHPNHLIRRAAANCGVSAFSFSVLEECEKDKCIQREQYWMNEMKPEYNIREKAGSPGYGRRHSAEEIQWRKIRYLGKNNPFYGKKHSPETIAHLRSVKRGKITPDEVKKKLSLASIKAQSCPLYRAKMSATIKAWWAAGRPSKPLKA